MATKKIGCSILYYTRTYIFLVPTHLRFNRTVDMCRSIKCEKRTWRLVTSLYRDRMETDVKQHEDEAMATDLQVRAVIIIRYVFSAMLTFLALK